MVLITNMSLQTGPILFYDGDCGFCNSSVRFVLRHERSHELMFAPVQGETARESLKDSGLPADIGSKSVVYMEGGHFYVRSRAALRVIRSMGGAWGWLAEVLGIVPTILADSVYDLIARYRSKLPHGDSCELLPPEQRSRFLP